MLVHQDHLGRVFDLGPFAGAGGSERRVDALLDSHEDDLDTELAVGLHAALDHLLGGKVPTHRIERDLHEAGG